MTAAKISDGLYWAAALVFVLTPPIVATDFGGILPWSQHVSALVLVLGCFAAAIARILSIGSIGELRLATSSFVIPGLIALIAMTAWFQTVALPSGLVSWLSPASYQAHGIFATELLGFPFDDLMTISIGPMDSRHTIAYLTIVMSVSFFSIQAFQQRDRISMMLIGLAIGGSTIAAIGLARKIAPGFELWSFKEGGEGAPFGTFLNRNNAALGLNLSVASALGLLVWRKFAFGSTESSRRRRSRNSTWLTGEFEWVQDPYALLAFVSLVISVLGLIACGSRGGLLSMIVAGSISLYVIRHQVGKLGGILVAVAVVSTALFFVLRTDSLGNQVLSENTFSQLESTIATDGRSLSTDTRLAHWPDGFRTALKHFPGGSGLATYGFAYLPWQQTSPWRWCAHADNLWLEMFVELGLMGVVILAIAAWWIVRSLARLVRSSDPIDRGLAITGCYAAASIAVSQFFDFGLIVPANLIAATILISVVVSRAPQSAKTPTSADQPRPTLQLVRETDNWWRSPRFLRQRLPQVVIGFTLLLCNVPAIIRLRRDSESDLYARMADQLLDKSLMDLQAIEGLIQSAESLAANHPHPELLDSLTGLRFQHGRLQELDQMNLGRMPANQQADRYAATSREQRRLGWRASKPELADHVTAFGRSVESLAVPEQFLTPQSSYSVALQHSVNSLLGRPLSFQPRIDQVYLEFVHQKIDRTQKALAQSSELFRNTPELQLRYGIASANHGAYSEATRYWRRAMQLDPNMSRRVLPRASKYPDFPVEALLPKDGRSRQQAVEFLKGYSVSVR